MVKIRNFNSFGAVFPHFCPNIREIGDFLLLLRVAKPIFGLLSKNNTGMAALRAGLPVKHFFVYSGRATHDPSLPYLAW